MRLQEIKARYFLRNVNEEARYKILKYSLDEIYLNLLEEIILLIKL